MSAPTAQRWPSAKIEVTTSAASSAAAMQRDHPAEPGRQRAAAERTGPTALITAVITTQPEDQPPQVVIGVPRPSADSAAAAAARIGTPAG